MEDVTVVAPASKLLFSIGFELTGARSWEIFKLKSLPCIIYLFENTSALKLEWLKIDL